MHEQVLKSHGLKVTENRIAILGLLQDSQAPLSAEELFQTLSASKGLNFSTVYRILSVFTEKHIVIKNMGGNGIAYYQLNLEQHMHYLVCNICHKKIPIQDCPIKKMTEELEKKTGFSITGHNLEFTGVCPECRKK